MNAVPLPNPQSWVALSVKQPWAALLAAGIKSVEVRTWATRRRGPVLLHASKIPDQRPEGWAWVEAAGLQEAAALRGGIIGAAELAECRAYRSAEAFAADQTAHRNTPSWFRPPQLFGFVFRDAGPVPFYPYLGQTMFFAVKETPGTAFPGRWDEKKFSPGRVRT